AGYVEVEDPFPYSSFPAFSLYVPKSGSRLMRSRVLRQAQAPDPSGAFFCLLWNIVFLNKTDKTCLSPLFFFGFICYNKRE
ncbi:MAG: hypothetical protein MR761_09175, partial [Butyricicoccus porcorum]|nr:hypothetical protein [Butyricicoccus porcorum]